MPNERLTEQLVRGALFALNTADMSDLVIEEQKSADPIIQRLLRAASKSDTGKVGHPEFIIRSMSRPDVVVVIECKAEHSKHSSGNLEEPRPVEYAVDGAIHYAKHLAKEYHVVAIAASGEVQLEITQYFLVRGNGQPPELIPDKSLLSFKDYVRLVNAHRFSKVVMEQDLQATAVKLHNDMRDHAKLSETEKPLLVSGALIALTDPAFAASYGLKANLPKYMLTTIDEVLSAANLPDGKRRSMLQPYSFIPVHEVLNKGTVLRDIVDLIYHKVYPYVASGEAGDVVGQFYGEFLSYTGGDKKGLGIVLTPKHITQLMVKLCGVNSHSVVLDPCAGTAAFLIAAMQEMSAGVNDSEVLASIKSNQLIGIEQQPNMYALAASNMLLRGDGKANLHMGSCFDSAIISGCAAAKPNVGLINPPYSQKGEGLGEMDFILNLLNMLQPGSLCAAIVPTSCAIEKSKTKADIQRNHTLLGVMSMPPQLFYPVGVCTVVMVFKSGAPHPPKFQSWFSRWNDDGHETRKNRGRVNISGNWPELMDSWVVDFQNQIVRPGYSVKQAVTPTDEWLAEAYIETDYTVISRSSIRQGLASHALHMLGSDLDAAENTNPTIGKVSARPTPQLDTNTWEYFNLVDLFDLKRGSKSGMVNMEPGATPIVSATTTNNGIAGYVDAPAEFQGSVLSVANNGEVGVTFLQCKPFCATSDITVLTPKKPLSSAALLFIATVIEQEKFRFGYGRKWGLDRMKQTRIKLPVKDGGAHNPDYTWMEEYIKTLPFSSCLG